MLSLLCYPAAAYSLSRQPFARPAVQVRTRNTQMSGRVHTPGLGGVDVEAKKTAVVFIEYQVYRFIGAAGPISTAGKAAYRLAGTRATLTLLLTNPLPERVHD